MRRAGKRDYIREVQRAISPDLWLGIALAAACLAAWELSTGVVAEVHSVDPTSDVIGGMWAVISTVFVIRASFGDSRRMARTRLLATVSAFVLCLAYLLVLPFSAVGMVILIGVGSVLVTRVWGADAAVTTGITIAVVMVVAGLSPEDPWLQPVLRSIDTAIGIVVGLAAAWSLRRLGLTDS